MKFDDESIKNIKPKNILLVAMLIIGTIGIILVATSVTPLLENEKRYYPEIPENYGTGFKDNVKAYANAYDPNNPIYDMPEVQESLKTIERTNSCKELEKLFTDNVGWTARAKLADKIVNQLKCV